MNTWKLQNTEKEIKLIVDYGSSYNLGRLEGAPKAAVVQDLMNSNNYLADLYTMFCMVTSEECVSEPNVKVIIRRWD